MAAQNRPGGHSAGCAKTFQSSGPDRLPRVRPCHRTASPWRSCRIANRHYGVAQPAMCRVGVRAGMPHRRYYDLRRTDGKVEASEALPDWVSV